MQEEQLLEAESLCVVVYWNERYNSATVRPHHTKFLVRAPEHEIVRAGWESLRFGDLIVGGVYRLPDKEGRFDGKPIEQYELRALREATQEELDAR